MPICKGCHNAKAATRRANAPRLSEEEKRQALSAYRKETKKLSKQCSGCRKRLPFSDFTTRFESGRRVTLARCRECMRDVGRKRLENPVYRESSRLRSSAWKLANLGYARQSQRDWYRSFRNRVLEKYGAQCSRCSFSDHRALDLDHINSGGCEERRKLGSGLQQMKRALLAPRGVFQLLCANCNRIKKYETPSERSGPKRRVIR